MKALFPFVAETDGVTVRVSVSYLPDQSEPDRARWFWAYHIRIENERDEVVQLLTRSWRITDGRGALHLVEGEGVIGEQPVIMPGKSYDYVSGCPLATPTGSMAGFYVMAGEDGERFEAITPQFPLVAPLVAQ